MKTFKKILATVLCVVMVFGSAPLVGFVGLELPSFAEIFTTKAEAATEGYYTYSVSDGEATITDVDESISGNIIIPSTLDGYPVTSIGDFVFQDCTGITSVTIPDSVTIIGAQAFNRCSELASVNIGNNVTSIGSFAFGKCVKLANINIPNSVVGIGHSAFNGCAILTSISIPDSVTSLGSYAFDECTSLASVTIGNNVSNIYDWTFYGCTSLASITLGNSVSNIGEKAFYGCTSLTSIELPDSITSIEENAFYGCTSLSGIELPDSITSIGKNAFYDTEYYTNESNWENSVLYIDNYIIKAETSLSGDYSVKKGTKVISSYAFSSCKNITTITIPDSVTSIGSYAFSYCGNLTSTIIPNSVTSIGSHAFTSCKSLTNIIIPYGVKSIDPHTFDGCTCLTNVTIPDSVTSIGSYAFSSCDSLISVTIGNSVTSIDYNAFSYCKSLTSITIPDGVTVIESSLFYNCSNLTSITIPDSVIQIKNNAFYNCTNLKNIYYDGAYRDWSKIVIGSNNDVLYRASHHYTYCYVSWYINGEILRKDRVKVGESIAVPADPEVIGYTFIGWDNEVPSIMPEKSLSFNAVLEIKQYTVKWNIDGEIQEEIYDYGEVITTPTPEKEGMLFLGWDKDVPATMPAENLEFTALWSETLFEYELDESIGGIVITGAKNASGDIEIPAKIDGYKVKLIAKGAFVGSDITSVTIPESVVFVQELAFAFCEKLETVNLSSNLAGVGEATFVGCNNIKEINIPADSEYLTTDEYGVIYTKDLSTLIYAPSNSIGDTYAMHPSTTTVLDYSFADCDDFTLILSDNLIVNDDSEFFNVLSVNGFVTSDACENFKAVDGVLYNKNVTKLIKYPVDSDRELLIIPESVKSIAGNYSFMSMSGNLMMYFVSGLPCDENTFDNLYKEPQYLTVHISSKNSLDENSLACLTFGPSHICIGDISESDVSYFDNEIEYVITQIETEWSEAEAELTPGTNEYYLSKVLILGYIDLLASFIDCQNDHTHLHKYAEVVDEKKGDCITDGYTSYDCECGYKFTDIFTASGHDYKSTVIEPSCTEKGYTTHTCSVCGDTYIDGESGGEGHKYSSVETKVTCTTDGYTTHTCSACGDTYIDGEIKAEGHKYEAETTKEPTCTTTGIKTFTCHCGDSYTEVIKVNGHSKGEWEYIGGKEYAKNCTVCGDKLESKVVTVNMTFNGENVNRKQILNKTTATVVATVTDNFANNLVFASSDDSVVSVDANGNVVANDIGKATISVTINGTAISDSIEVEVLPRDFTITWNVNGKQTKQTVKEYATVTPNVNTTRPGYKFIGWDFEVPSTMPAENLLFTAKFELSFKMSIRNPSTITISYGDSIILHADMNEALPDGWKIKWTADNGNFSYSANGDACTISPNKSGDTTFTATVYDENGNEICKDTQTMKSKAGFFDKFVAFFKKLFGLTKVIQQSLNTIY